MPTGTAMARLFALAQTTTLRQARKEGGDCGSSTSAIASSTAAISIPANPQFTGRLGTSSSFPNITQGTNKADAYSLGLKWLPNYYTRFMVNLIHTEFDTPVTVNGQNTTYENAITLRAQVDF